MQAGAKFQKFLVCHLFSCLLYSDLIKIKIQPLLNLKHPQGSYNKNLIKSNSNNLSSVFINLPQVTQKPNQQIIRNSYFFTGTSFGAKFIKPSSNHIQIKTK